MKKTDSVCLSCGSSCGINVSTKDGEVIKINAGMPEGLAERYMCAIGRYGFDSLLADKRVNVPMKKINGELKETTWDDALAIAAEKLKSAGPEAAFVSSGNILNEDAVLLKKLASDVVKTKHYDSSVSLYSDSDAMKCQGADLEAADLFILAGISPDQWKRVLPALAAITRKRVSAGVKLIVINSGEPRISGAASVFLKGDEIKMMEELAQALISKGVKAPKEMIEALAQVNPSDDAVNAADIFIASKSPVILTSPSLYKAAANFSLIKGDVVAVPLEANAKGVTLMGLVSDGKKFSEIISSRSKLLYAVGETPVNKRPETDFLIVQNSHMSELASQADLILPSTPPLESSGTIVDYLGRLRQVNRACGPFGNSRSSADIFIAVAGAMGSQLKPAKDTDIKKALKTKTKTTFSPFKKAKGLDADPEKFIQDINESIINGSRLLWLKEHASAVAV